jgi:N-[(2S)-2-amino-2-carboxyethyl]-L-glutamate dehydrogenase
MGEDDILILKGNEINALLTGEETALLRTVGRAYEAHAQGRSSLPHSTFLGFPADRKNRIIALPAYLGNEFGVAGMKWIASFPGNFEKGLDRASAVVILNSPLTGRAHSVMEGSIISAKRTAASAALAARCLQNGQKVNSVGILGCGLINFEIVRFLLVVFPELSAFTIYDIDVERANGFRNDCQAAFDGLVVVEVVADVQTLLKKESLISIATTATHF